MEDFKPIARAARYIWGLSSIAIALIIGSAWTGAFAYVYGGTGLAIAGTISIVVCGFLWWTTGRRWRAWGYAERERDLIIRRGVLVKRVTFVPYGRMQFVELKQGPFDRLINTYELQLHTAAAATDAKIPLIPADEAHRLRKSLTELGETYAAGL